MLTLLAAACLVTPANAPIWVGGMLVHPARLLVKPVSMGDVSAYRRTQTTVLRSVPQIGWQVVSAPPDRLVETYEALRSDATIAQVQFDKCGRIAYTPNDPMFVDQWDMTRIKANLAWDTQRGSASVKLAIMDTGVEVTHPDLSPNIWVNPGEIPNNGIDDDNNGYVDDVNGYDFAYNDGNPDDQYGHGTACAGIAAAAQDNSIGISGVAPRCKIVAIKASTDEGYFYDSANVPALVYIADTGCKVVSMSFYSDGVTPAERDAIDYAWNHGVVPVCAAGNDNQVFPYYPAAYENTLAVAATNSSDNKASFSNWGTWVSVAAPGTSLPATSLGGGYTTSFGGTSGACPHVAGLAALLFSQSPSATNAQVRAAIEDSSTLLTQSPYGVFTKYGMVNCQAAIARIQGTTSGAVPARFLFAEPVGGGKIYPSTSTGGISSALMIYGVGFEGPATLRVLVGGSPVPYFTRSRNSVLISRPLNSQVIALEIGGVTIGSFNFAAGTGLVYSPTDASTKGSGATATGGFKELYRSDGLYFTCTERSDGTILVHMPVRKIANLTPERIDISYKRYYQSNVGGVESVQLYDWSTASFPYGSWVTVATSNITNSSVQTISIPITSNPSRFIDPEGTIYVQISTTAPGTSAKLFADSFRVTVR
jgi:thermitase